MGLCTDSCCNKAKRDAEAAVAEEHAFLNRIQFYAKRARDNGETADRFIQTDLLPEELSLVVEPEVIESKNFGTCRCSTCECDTLRTIANPGTCKDCQNGWHSTAGAA